MKTWGEGLRGQAEVRSRAGWLGKRNQRGGVKGGLGWAGWSPAGLGWLVCERRHCAECWWG